MNLETGFLPMVRYRHHRSHTFTDRQWNDQRASDEFTRGMWFLNTLAFKYSDGVSNERWVAGGFYADRMRDFCGGLIVSSAFTRSYMHGSTQDYRRRIFGATAAAGMLDLNEILEEQNISREQATKFMRRCVAYGILSAAIQERRTTLIWADKSGGSLSTVMAELPDGIYETYEQAIGCQTKAVNSAAPETLRFTQPSYLVADIEVRTTKGEGIVNWNSGNTVHGYSTTVKFPRSVGGNQCTHCGWNNDTGATRCYDCDRQLDESPDRPAELPRAIIAALKTEDQWRHMPIGPFKNG